MPSQEVDPFVFNLLKDQPLKQRYAKYTSVCLPVVPCRTLAHNMYAYSSYLTCVLVFIVFWGGGGDRRLMLKEVNRFMK